MHTTRGTELSQFLINYMAINQAPADTSLITAEINKYSNIPIKRRPEHRESDTRPDTPSNYRTTWTILLFISVRHVSTLTNQPPHSVTFWEFLPQHAVGTTTGLGPIEPCGTIADQRTRPNQAEPRTPRALLRTSGFSISEVLLH